MEERVRRSRITVLALMKCGFSAAEALEMPEAEAACYLELVTSFRGGKAARGGKGKAYVVRRNGK